jgi:PAS domain S-box-containing protein
VFEDITARKKAEATLLETNDRLQALVASSPLGIVILDRDKNIRTWNPAAEEIFGWTASEVIGKPIPFVPAELRQEYMSIIEKTMAGQTLANYETKRVKKSGQMIDISLTTTALRGLNGEYMGIMGIIADITDRRRADETLRKLATAVEQSAESIVITNPETVIEYVNPAFEKITGYFRKDVLGKDIHSLEDISPDDMMRPSILGTLRRGEIWTGRRHSRKKDGSRFIEEATISPITNGAGQIVNFVAVARDVTNEITLAEQLLHAQKMEAVGRLAGGVAHDFNNLLTAITGYCELLITQLGSSPLRSDVEEILKSGERAAELTRQLLTFSRKQIIQPRALDLNATVSGMEKMLCRLIGEDIELRTSLGQIGAIKADPGQIEQVIMNLAVNAKDAMPNGGVLSIDTDICEIDVNPDGALPESRAGAYVKLTVSDTGAGMDEETKSRIFEPFFTTKELGRGTGLGLSTVFGIVEQNGGMIEVTSAPGEGSSFNICFPLYADELDEAIGIATRPASLSGSETILLVEDEDIVRNLIVRSLTDRGYRVLSCGDPVEAIELCRARAGDIHLLLTDLVMPRLSGDKVAESIREFAPNIKVIYMSGYTNNQFSRQSNIRSEYDFIHKPFKMDQLAAKVRDILDGKRECAAFSTAVQGK